MRLPAYVCGCDGLEGFIQFSKNLTRSEAINAPGRRRAAKTPRQQSWASVLGMPKGTGRSLKRIRR